MKNKNFWIYGTVILLTILFIASALIFKIYEIEIIAMQFYGALIGVVITAIITVFLLKGQTDNEEQRERSIKVFEKKQDIYHNFLENIKEIIKDGKITIYSDSNTEKNIDELKELLFQLGYIQMHTSNENTHKVFEKVSNIIQLMNDFDAIPEEKDKDLPKYYANLSENLFEIVSILKSDLYGVKNNTIQKKSIENLLSECGLSIEKKDFNKYELQGYFWNTLQDKLIEEGYKISKKDFTRDIGEYYARGRNRHRYYGFNFPIYTMQNGEEILFRIENEYQYGFLKTEENTEKIENILKDVSKGFKINSENWSSYKPSDRYKLDFWNGNSKEFRRLRNPRLRKQLMDDIIDEMLRYINSFVKKATREKL